MKKLFLVMFLVLTIFAYSLELTAYGGMELGGKNRPYVGARIGFTDSLIGISVDTYFPFSIDQTSEEVLANIQNAKFIEMDPYLVMTLRLGGIGIYAGAAPILIIDIDDFNFSLYSKDLFHVKAGLKFGKGIIIFIEGITTMNLDMKFSDVFAVHGGLGFDF